LSLSPEERETVISWADDDNCIFIYTTQRRMLAKLMHNPIFSIKRKIMHGNTLIGVEGYLPLNGISIRTKVSISKTRKAQLSKMAKKNFGWEV